MRPLDDFPLLFSRVRLAVVSVEQAVVIMTSAGRSGAFTVVGEEVLHLRPGLSFDERGKLFPVGEMGGDYGGIIPSSSSSSSIPVGSRRGRNCGGIGSGSHSYAQKEGKDRFKFDHLDLFRRFRETYGRTK